MRQLEMIVTPDGFRDGLREYLKQHAFGNATWPDLIALLDGARPRISRPGAAPGSKRPAGRRSRPSCSRTGGSALAFRQQDPIGRARAALDAAAEGGARQRRRDRAARRRPARRAGDSRRRDARAPPRAYDFVLPTGGGIGYGDFVLDADSRALPARAPRRHSGSADARRALGHALGRDARRPGRARTRCSTTLTRRAAARARRAERPADARLHAAGCSGGS